MDWMESLIFIGVGSTWRNEVSSPRVSRLSIKLK